MPFVVTPLYAGLLGLLYTVLACLVILQRWRAGVGLGHGGDRTLRKLVRVHANFAEYVPFLLLLMAFLEVQHTPRATLHLLGATLLAARVAHAAGLARRSGPSLGRSLGAGLTLLLLVVASVMAILSAL